MGYIIHEDDADDLRGQPQCECAGKGIPEGYLCGKRGCPRTIALEQSFNDPNGRMRKFMQRLLRRG